MARYLVERSFPEGLEIPVNGQGAQICQDVIQKNAEDDVTWVHSYVSEDKRKSFCIYDAPSPEAIILLLNNSEFMNSFIVRYMGNIAIQTHVPHRRSSLFYGENFPILWRGYLILRRRRRLVFGSERRVWRE